MSDYVPENYTAQLMLGLAELLVGHDFGVYREDADYVDGERGIYFDFSPPMPTTTPQESITITPYLPQSGPLAIEHTSVQFRYRHVNRHPLWVRDFLDRVRGLFPEQRVMVIGGHTFDRIYQRSSTTWGEEDRPGVLTSTQNFAFRGNRYAA